YQHLVYYTHPYHPELQPIELFWANIKGGIADDPAFNMAELQVKIDEGVEYLESDTWTNATRPRVRAKVFATGRRV
ncbi:hypothetical protein JG688_00013953, partial [Phytophthora aleatoria]